MARKSNKKPLIYLADLTHTSQIPSANVHPLGIGLIAAYAISKFGAEIDIELFKYPDDFAQALDNRPPDIVGLSNYCWNLDLAYGFAQRIKARHPDTVIVMGGPNYGFTDEETGAFWRDRAAVDFYIIGEGECAFVELVSNLGAVDFDAGRLKSQGGELANVHYAGAKGVVKGELLPRIADLEEIPSPYLTGLMDKFFDDVLIPALHTTRGCPFSCSFCSEGSIYYSKVTKRQNIADELEYMAKRVGGVPDLIMTDANFGMYKEDIGKAEVLSRIFDDYQWPKHIQVAGGKNQKQRLREVMRVLEGRMDVSASLQSTDKKILENINRKNISYGELKDLGVWSQELKARSFVELILGLPGDTVGAHKKSLSDSIRSGVNLVRMHQLMMLPQTEMVTPESRARYGFKTKFRVVPRSFGKYRVFGEDFTAVEYDEVCVEQDSMTFEEYIECRMLDLSVEIIHNGNVFIELFMLSEKLGLDWAGLIFDFHARRGGFPAKLEKVYDLFHRESIDGLWDDPVALKRHVEDNLEHYIETNQGVNQLAITNAKARAFFDAQSEIHDLFYDLFEAHLDAKGGLDDEFHLFLTELRRYSRLRKTDLLNAEMRPVEEFSFDMPAIFRDGAFADFAEYRHRQPLTYLFAHDSLQRETIDGYVRQYGKNFAGFGRVLMKVPFHRILRDGHPINDGAMAEVKSA